MSKGDFFGEGIATSPKIIVPNERTGLVQCPRRPTNLKRQEISCPQQRGSVMGFPFLAMRGPPCLGQSC